MKIIDISAWQSPNLIDYDKLSSEIDGVILRIGYGIWKDTRFDEHYANFSRRNKPIGCYHYIIGNYGGLQQAECIQPWAAGHEFKLGYWGDVEDTRAGTALTNKVTDSYLGNADKLIGKPFGVYTSMYSWRQITGDSKAHGKRLLWVAHYTTAAKPLMPAGWDKWYLWQYTDRERFEGYKQGGLDCSRFNTDYPSPIETTPAPIEVSDVDKLDIVYNWWLSRPDLH